MTGYLLQFLYEARQSCETAILIDREGWMSRGGRLSLDQSRTIPQGGAPVALGIRYTPPVDRRLVCPLVPVHQGCTTARSLRKNF